MNFSFLIRNKLWSTIVFNSDILTEIEDMIETLIIKKTNENIFEHGILHQSVKFIIFNLYFKNI